ncbi:MAG: hydrogenase [Thermoplasmata archaeon]|nr:MAG: hydrogenase [Thermoplasmata archaeon]
MLERIFTGSGFWNPLIWLIAFVVSILIVLILRSLGRPGFKREGDKTKPFLCGNIKDIETISPRSENLYWGFRESLKGYYKVMERFHSGDIRDYIFWFIFVIVLLFLMEVL